MIKSYKNHPSILEINENFSPDIVNFMVQKHDISKVKKLANEVDVKKAVVIDTISPALIKISSNIIAEPMTIAISSCLT